MLCPICKKTTIVKYRPFCSERCQQIDLLNWLNERYKIETNESERTSDSSYIDEFDDDESV